jgi:hypothetical protein
VTHLQQIEWCPDSVGHAMVVEQVTLQYETDGWIMATTETGRSGLIPNTYLRILSTQTPFQDDPFGAAQQADPFAGGDPFAGRFHMEKFVDPLLDLGVPGCVSSV